MNKYIFCSFFCFILFSACQKKQLVQSNSKTNTETVKAKPKLLAYKKIQLGFNELKVNEIQEKLTLKDEVLLIANVSVFENEKLIQTISKSTFLKKVKAGATIKLDSLQIPLVELKEKQTLGIQVSLWEVDNYQQINEAVRQINQVGGILQLPITLLEWSSVSNPVSWFLWGSRLSGLGLNWLEKNDKNDLIGVSELQWKFEEIPSYKAIRSKKEVFNKQGNRLTNFNYVLTYQIATNPVLK